MRLSRNTIFGTAFLLVIVATSALIANSFHVNVPVHSEYTITKEGSTYSVDLKLEITDNYLAYQDLANFFRKLPVEDTVVLKLHNYGGSVQSGFILLNGIYEAKAKVIADVDGPTYSMGSAIACSTKEIRMGKYSYLMFHRASAGSLELGNKIQEAVAIGNLGCVEKGILPLEEVKNLINIPGYEYYYWEGKK